jgi:hypothetical protein
MNLLIGLVLFYSGHIIYRLLENAYKRQTLQVGDVCSIFIGETKFTGFVVKISQDIDVWVVDKIVRLNRSQIYV